MAVSARPPYKKDWVLTPEAFEKLLACLDGDRSRAAERYENIRRKLVSFFRWRDCSRPEDFADRTIDRVARRIAEGTDLQGKDPYVYFHGVALNVLREHWRSPEPKFEVLEEGSPSQPISHTPAQSQDTGEWEDGPRLDCLDRCLRDLSEESRNLLVQYHQKERRAKIDARREIAEKLRIPLNALRIRVHRLRAALRACVAECVERTASPEMPPNFRH
jgi:DNA-directed RNA polymerase specialized sigma24 family protein